MSIGFLVERLHAWGDRPALIEGGRVSGYDDLLQEYLAALAVLDGHGVVPGSIVALESDFSVRSTAFLLALIAGGAIVVPMTASVRAQAAEFRAVAQVEYSLVISPTGEVSCRRRDGQVTHDLLLELRSSGRPGLILFSSGTTGKSKAILHDFTRLLERFRAPGKAKRMIGFLLFDHIGGINTLLYTLAAGGVLVTVEERTPGAVVAAIERDRVEVLPTSPTFLNLLLMSGALQGRDLSSLELITYGTEPMPEATLKRMRTALPQVELRQTYGLSELGIMRAQSRSSDSLWVRVGGEGCETRVRDGLLEVKAAAAMLGYLNAPSPLTDDGWFMTGDRVEVDGDYLRFLGRESEIINVGGEKVWPAEVENALLSLDGVTDAVVAAGENPVTGSIVKATVELATGERPGEFRTRMRSRLREMGLSPYKIPQKVVISGHHLYSERFKKIR